VIPFAFAVVVMAGCFDAERAKMPSNTQDADTAAKCLKAMKARGSTGWGLIADRAGLRITNVVLVHSRVAQWPDYYLLSFADVQGDTGSAKVDLDGTVTSVVAKPRLMVAPPDAEILELLTAVGLHPRKNVTWVLVRDSDRLGVYAPFGPLAEVGTEAGTVYVNGERHVFIEDPAGSLSMETTDRTLYLRQIR
jgi:hypothetical protein